MIVTAKSASPRTLDALFAGIAEAPAVTVDDMTLLADKVRPNGLYLARQGKRRHGLEFVDTAIERGASAVAYELPAAAPVDLHDVVWVPVIDLGRKLGTLAQRFFESPADALSVDAVTGTNGKSTVAWLIASAQIRLGTRSAYLGTLGAGILPELQPQTLTTPDVIELSRSLRQFANAGASHAVLEASSHALDQDRLAGLSIRSAIFTNLSHDHLDYHGSPEAYFEAKARLFERPELETRIVHIDTPAGQALAERYADAIGVSRSAENSSRRGLVLRNLKAHAGGQSFVAEYAGRSVQVDTPLLGAFNVDNLGCALALLVSRGIGLEEAAAALATVNAPPGRMELVTAVSEPAVVVDFAHTPDALELALQTLRMHTRGALWCVFGCGGDRDRAKRPLMGSIASQLADEVVVTSDNPRTEAPEMIVNEILAGVIGGARVRTELDRALAIRLAISEAAPDDLVLIAGKGHETQQIDASGQRFFSDQQVAKQLLAEFGPC